MAKRRRRKGEGRNSRNYDYCFPIPFRTHAAKAGSVGKLASAASVSDTAVDDFELERRPPDVATADAIQRAFEDVGVEFLPLDDVRLRDRSAVR